MGGRAVGWLSITIAWLLCLWVVWAVPADQRLLDGRYPAPWPSVAQLLRPGGLNTLETALADRIPRREWLLRLRSGLYGSLLGQTGSGRVAAGRAGWLFITEDGPYDWYLGRAAPPSGATTRAVARAIVARVEQMRQAGLNYSLVLVPDKHQVYPDYLVVPWNLAPRGYSWTQQVFDLLPPATRLRVIHMLPLLQQAREKATEPLYYASDSHWTHQGARLGWEALTRLLGLRSADPPALVTVLATTDLPRLAGLDPGKFNERVATMATVYPECRPGSRANQPMPRPEQIDILLLIDSFGEAICDWIRSGNPSTWADRYQQTGGALGALPEPLPRLALIEQVSERGLRAWADRSP
jgi:hypothetical protein